MGEGLTGDPRFEGLPDAVVEGAKSAYCSRCKIQIVEDPGMAGTVFVNYYVPAVGVRQRMFLCGNCGLAFREFLVPGLADDPLFQAVKAELQARW